MQTKKIEVIKGVNDEHACFQACYLKYDPIKCGYYTYRTNDQECTTFEEAMDNDYFDCDIIRGPTSPEYDASVSHCC